MNIVTLHIILGGWETFLIFITLDIQIKFLFYNLPFTVIKLFIADGIPEPSIFLSNRITNNIYETIE